MRPPPRPCRRPDQRPVRLLLTAFGPFPGVAENVSASLVRALQAELRSLPGLCVFVAELPTLWREAEAALLVALGEARPHLALHFGVSQSSGGFELETRARNLCNGLPDAAGATAQCRAIEPGGPPWLQCPLDLAHARRAIAATGARAKLSRDAGGYLCNAVYYRSLLTARRQAPGHGALFVHIPTHLGGCQESEAPPPQGCGIPFALARRAGLALIAALMNRKPET